MLKMVSIVQAANAIYQNPLNFGDKLGFIIVGAKVHLFAPNMRL
jgi:type III secretory pathway component EscS